MLNCCWCCNAYFKQLFPNLDKVVFLDDDVVIQRDLSPLWEIDLNGKVNGAVETCKGEDAWVMSKRFRNYFNFSHPLVAKSLDPKECAWAYGMNIFDLRAWRKTNIRETYHAWLKEVNKQNQHNDVFSLTLFKYFCEAWLQLEFWIYCCRIWGQIWRYGSLELYHQPWLHLGAMFNLLNLRGTCWGWATRRIQASRVYIRLL